jgi:hypothetical protein
MRHYVPPYVGQGDRLVSAKQRGQPCTARSNIGLAVHRPFTPGGVQVGHRYGSERTSARTLKIAGGICVIGPGYATDSRLAVACPSIADFNEFA